MSASIIYVLSTRPLSAASIEEAAAKGIAIDVLPFIGTEQVQDEKLTGLLGESIKRSLSAVFTSTNAVTAVAAGITPLDGRIAAGSGWKIFCIEGATQRAVADRFGEAAIAGTGATARELAAEIIRHGQVREVWFFCGDRRREELPGILQAAGVTVHEVVVYRTTLTPQRIGKSYDAIIFFSPSAAESFFSANTIDPHIPLFAIGPTTAATLTQKCSNPVSVSKRPDETILIRQLIERLEAARPKDRH